MVSSNLALARTVNRIFARKGAVLDGRYHHRLLRTPREVRHAIAYVLLNARKHLEKRGISVRAHGQVDPASSGRFFDGWARKAQPLRSEQEPSVARPRSWLARIGWRRHGLIDPGETTGS